MVDWRVAVAPENDSRFVVWLVDVAGLQVKGPDGGAAHEGYTADELHPVLRNNYGLSASEITERIAAAKAARLKIT